MGAVNRATKKAGLASPEASIMVFWKELVQEYLVGTREKLGEELSRKYDEEGARMSIEEVIAYALDVERD